MPIDYEEYGDIVAECEMLSVSKNKDYGTACLMEFKEKGIIVRLHDKIARLKNLVWNDKEACIQDERIEDTLKDIINYSIYMIMMQRGNLK